MFLISVKFIIHWKDGKVIACGAAGVVILLFGVSTLIMIRMDYPCVRCMIKSR